MHKIFVNKKKENLTVDFLEKIYNPTYKEHLIALSMFAAMIKIKLAISMTIFFLKLSLVKSYGTLCFKSLPFYK